MHPLPPPHMLLGPPLPPMPLVQTNQTPLLPPAHTYQARSPLTQTRPLRPLPPLSTLCHLPSLAPLQPQHPPRPLPPMCLLPLPPLHQLLLPQTIRILVAVALLLPPLQVPKGPKTALGIAHTATECRGPSLPLQPPRLPQQSKGPQWEVR